MSPEKARVLLVDDNRGYRETLAEYLQMAGHIIAAEAGSLEEALEIIKKLKDIDIALIDGNLSRTSQGGFDGAKIAKAFRAKFPGKPLFAISLDSQPWSDDPSLTKEAGSFQIAKRVTQA